MINPILDRELKTRMRTWKTPLMLTVYAGILGLILLLFYSSEVTGYNYMRRGFDPSIFPIAFDVIVVIQTFLLMLIVPILTATSISGERERQTLDLLLCTDLPVHRIVLGKMYASLTYVFLIVFSSMPFLGIMMLFGGVGIFDIIKITLFLLVSSCMLSSIGMVASVFFKKNITAIMMTFLFMGILFVAPFVLIFIAVILVNAFYYTPIQSLLDNNLADIVNVLFGLNPGYGILSLLTSDNFTVSGLIGYDSGITANVPSYVVSLIWYCIVTPLFTYIAIRRLAKIK